MDPVTHGIAGALLGKAFFSKRQERVTIFAATLGAVFPDIDIVAEISTRDPLSIVKYHRAITHSFVGLPVFAVLLALLTRWALPWVKKRWPRFQDWEAPPLWLLIVIYGVGIASHILLDGMTSFGTRMWYPISTRRVAWDLLFIIDFSFTAIILAPQVIPWICRFPEKARGRALKMWIFFTAMGLLFWLLAGAAGYPFHLWIAAAASALFAVLFFLPARGGAGSRLTRTEWAQIGAFAALVYLFACSVAHHVALVQTKRFADMNHIDITRIGALPIPPSWLDWGEAVRSKNALYERQVDLRRPDASVFNFVPDSPPDEYIGRAFETADVQLYWSFARFPSVHSFRDGDEHVVDFGENRFQDNRRQRGPQPFTWEVIFDKNGNLIEEGWLTNGMLQSRMRRLIPQPTLPPQPAKKSS
jgi:membrane-bound metal-dependent hydrolase YbcI (DUF457 family)